MPQIVTRKEVFIVPYWIKNLLDRHRLPLVTALDLSKLKEIASTEDLVLTYLLNENNAALFGSKAAFNAQYFFWGHPKHTDALASLLSLTSLHLSGLQERLFDESNLDAAYPTAFEIHDVSTEAFIIVINPGHFGGSQAVVNQRHLVRAYLKQWYGYSSYQEMAQSPLFEQYVNSL